MRLSGIATYSQAGAQFGYGLAWTMLFTYPLMTAVQMVSARMGRTTGRGLAGILRQHYPKWLLSIIVLLLLIANTINIGADLGAMADATRLVVGGPQVLWLVLFAGVCTAMQVLLQYTQYVSVLKWLALVLLAYVATLFMVHVPWAEALTGLVVPTIQWNKDYLTTFVAVLGTTISPYQPVDEVVVQPGRWSQSVVKRIRAGTTRLATRTIRMAASAAPLLIGSRISTHQPRAAASFGVPAPINRRMSSPRLCPATWIR